MQSLCRIAALTAALALLPTATAAEVYKWVDDEGITHYSQQPPASGEAIRFDPAVSRAPADDTATEPESDEDVATSDGAEEDDGAPATVEEYCEQMREEAEILSSNDAVQVRQDDGSLQKLEGEAREQRLQEAQARIAEHCGE